MLNTAYTLGVEAALEEAGIQKEAYWQFPVAGAMTQVAYDSILNPRGPPTGYVNSALKGALTAGSATLGKNLAHRNPLLGGLVGGLAGYYFGDKLVPGRL